MSKPVIITWLVPEGLLNEHEFSAEAIQTAREHGRWRSSSKLEPWYFVKERGRIVDHNVALRVEWEDQEPTDLSDVIAGENFFAIERYGLGGSL